MTDTLERCARALCDTPASCQSVYDGFLCGNCPRKARAVLSALMEPDEAMLRAGEDAYMDQDREDRSALRRFKEKYGGNPAFESQAFKAGWQAALRSVLGGEDGRA